MSHRPLSRPAWAPLTSDPLCAAADLKWAAARAHQQHQPREPAGPTGPPWGCGCQGLFPGVRPRGEAPSPCRRPPRRSRPSGRGAGSADLAQAPHAQHTLVTRLGLQPCFRSLAGAAGHPTKPGRHAETPVPAEQGPRAANSVEVCLPGAGGLHRLPAAHRPDTRSHTHSVSPAPGVNACPVAGRSVRGAFLTPSREFISRQRQTPSVYVYRKRSQGPWTPRPRVPRVAGLTLPVGARLPEFGANGGTAAPEEKSSPLTQLPPPPTGEEGAGGGPRGHCRGPSGAAGPPTHGWALHRPRAQQTGSLLDRTGGSPSGPPWDEAWPRPAAAGPPYPLVSRPRKSHPHPPPRSLATPARSVCVSPTCGRNRTSPRVASVLSPVSPPPARMPHSGFL